MSLTEAEGIFVGLHENGLNDLLSVVMFPRFRNYGPAVWPQALAPAPSQWTPAPSIPFVDYAVQIKTIPGGDVDPLTPASPWSVAGPADMVWRTTLDFSFTTFLFPWNTTTFTIAAKVSVVVTNLGAGVGEISFIISGPVDIQPAPSPFLGSVITGFLNAALTPVHIPFAAVRAGAFTFTLSRGPETETDQVKLYGSVV